MHHRIFLPTDYVAGELVDVTADEFHHAVRVVRVREREEVELFDGRGKAASAVVESLDRERITLRVIAPIPSRESPLKITLAMAIIALDKFELVLQKATELGVAAIVPVVTDRVELRAERYRGKHERWEKILFEAVKQCGRAVLPMLQEPEPFADVVARDGMKMLFDADAQPSETIEAPESMTIFIGPEGGWSDDELASARANGCLLERLGPRRLRAETAAIAAITRIAARWGDL